MVVDSSVLVAIVLNEARKIEFISRLTAAFSLKVSAVTLTEASTVLLARGGVTKVNILDALLERFMVEIVSVDRAQALLARHAYDQYGRGRHKADLNLGDCFSYALAKYTGEPLLFQGNDFGQTDITVV